MIRNPAIAFVLVAFALPRLAVLAFYGPIFFDDSTDYTLYAERILAGTEWVHTAEIGEGMPITYLRLPGYPFVIAATKALFGSNFAYAIVTLQTTLSLAATLTLFTFARILLDCPWRASAVASFFAITLSVLLDLTILADSLVTSLFVLLFSSLGAMLIGSTTVRPTQALALGLGAMGLLLLRGNGVIIAATLGPLAIAAISITRINFSQKALCAFLIVLPMTLSVWGLRTWNEYRSGMAFISTGAEHVAFQPLFRMARAGDNPFDDQDHPYEQTVRSHAASYEFTDIANVISALHRDHSLSHPEITTWITRKYTLTLISRPFDLTMAVATIRHVKAVLATANPIATGVEIHQDISGRAIFPPMGVVLHSPISSLSTGQLAIAVPYLLFGILSLTFVVVAAIGTPVAAFRHGFRQPASIAIMSLWLTYGGMFTMYALIHLELRYVVCIAPIPILLALAVFRLRGS